MLLINNSIRRILSYILIGSATAVASTLVSKKKLTLRELSLISIISATTFLILDIFTPTIGLAAKYGAGAGIGVGMADGGASTAVLSGSTMEAFQANDQEEKTEMMINY